MSNDSILCATCGRNSQKFPFVQCHMEPMGPASNYEDNVTKADLKDLLDMNHTVCDQYRHRDVPWASVRFIFSDKTYKEFHDLIQHPVIEDIHHNGLLPIKIGVGAGGIFTPAQRSSFQSLFYGTVKKAMHPIDTKIIFYGKAEELLTP